MGKNLKRLKRPRREKIQNPGPSPELGKLWILDIAAKATYYPTTMKAYKRIMARLIEEKREFKTSQAA